MLRLKEFRECVPCFMKIPFFHSGLSLQLPVVHLYRIGRRVKDKRSKHKTDFVASIADASNPSYCWVCFLAGISIQIRLADTCQRQRKKILQAFHEVVLLNLASLLELGRMNTSGLHSVGLSYMRTVASPIISDEKQWAA